MPKGKKIKTIKLPALSGLPIGHQITIKTGKHITIVKQ